MDCEAKWEYSSKVDAPRKYRETYTYQFPSDKILKAEFRTPEQVMAYLIKSTVAMGSSEGQLYSQKAVIRDGCTRYAYQCNRKNCRSILEYEAKPCSLVLQKLNSRHNHKIKITPKKAKTQEIKQYLMDLPAEDNLENHIQSVKDKFNLNKQQAKYIKSKLFWRFQNDEDLLEKLTQLNATFRRDVENGILLICSETMKSSYRKFGDLLCFDVTYKLLKKKKKQQKHLGVGFFVGQDENTRIVLFGMCTISHESADNFKRLFSFFFQCMNGVIPQTILTDNQVALVSALKVLKLEHNYKYSHLLDWYHKIESIKKIIRRDHHKQVLFPLICRILKQPSKQVYHDIALEIIQFLSRKQMMIDFLKDKDKCCLSQVPCSFFGFGVSSTRAESMNNLIKRSVSHQTNLGKLVFFVLRVQSRLLNNMNSLTLTNEKVLVNVHDEEVMKLSQHLEHLAFDQIRQYYECSLELNIRQIDPTTVEVPYVKYDRQYYFRVKYDLRSGCWVCECKAIYKTGMPCPHLIKAIRRFGGSIGYYINERWFHQKEKGSNFKLSCPPIASNRRRI